MNTENKDWKPEVGKTVWFRHTEDGSHTAIYEGKVRFSMVHSPSVFGIETQFLGTPLFDMSVLFPTAEAALASIKVYDLDGNEVVVARAEHRKTDKDLHARAMHIQLSDEAGMMNYSWETCLKMAKEAAIGGESSTKEDSRDGSYTN